MRCNRPGCPGEIVDGYCDICLEEPLDEAAVEPPRPPDEPGPAGGRPNRPPENGRSGDSPPPGVRPGNTGPWWGLDLLPDLGARNVPEPDQLLLSEPSVPQEHWKCRQCHNPVGRSHHGQIGLRKGYCVRCGTPYSPQSYGPRLRKEMVVDGRYKILGCVGQGGVGWVYAAQDLHLDGHWVALKGLVDNVDEHSKNAVKAEKHFLLSIDHERIVRIKDSVAHPSDDGDGDDLYLVMEYIHGYPLSDARFADHSVEDAIGCVLQILQAMDYLHQNDYLFCDLKPSNVMFSPSGVKLIDLGAVNSDWSTLEFSAPELASSGRSVATDLYTVGLTLQILVERRSTVPETLRRVIDCATRNDPARRFSSAAIFADQLSGVLGEMAAHGGGPARPVPSRLFSPGAGALDGGLGAAPPLEWWTSVAARRAAEDGVSRALPVETPDPRRAAALLPEPYPDPLDAGAGFLATSVSVDPLTAAGQLDAYADPTPEILFRKCRVRLSLGELDSARSALRVLPEDGDWRRAWLEDWHRGLIALAADDAATAARHFRGCRDLVPGEAAPRFALALCAEIQGRAAEAKRDYSQVWTIDRSCEGAAFGLARVALRDGDRATAVAVLDRIPGTSPHHQVARIAAIRVLSGRLSEESAGLPGAEDLREAAERLSRDRIDRYDRQRLTACVLESALELVGTGATLPAAEPLSANDGPAEIREKLKDAFLRLCGQAPDTDDQTILVDLANSVRNVSWW